VTISDDELRRVAAESGAKPGEVGELRRVYWRGVSDANELVRGIVARAHEHRLDEVRKQQKSLWRKARRIKRLRAELDAWRALGITHGLVLPASSELPCPVCRATHDDGHKLDCPRNRGKALTITVEPIRAVVP